MILLYNNYRSLSISSREGIEFAVPILVVDKPAVALANFRASLIFWPSVSAAAKPALKASPAPVVSTTGFERLATGKENFSSLLAKKAPFSPRVITTFLIPVSYTHLRAHET